MTGAAELLVWDESAIENLFPNERPCWDVAKLLDESDFVLKNIIVRKCRCVFSRFKGSFVFYEHQVELLLLISRPLGLDSISIQLIVVIYVIHSNTYYTLKALSKCGNAQTLAENVVEDVVRDSASETLARACCLKYVAHAMINRGNLVPEVGCFIYLFFWNTIISQFVGLLLVF